MSVIRHKGAPTKRTPGGVGSILVDINTGKQYTCTFGYCTNGVWEYTWKETGVVEKVNAAKPVENKTESVVEEKPVIPQEKETIEPVIEEPVEPVRKPQRTNYTQYSKKSK